MMKVLIPVDGSGNDQFAVQHVVKQFMNNTAMEVHLLNVQAPFSARHRALHQPQEPPGLPPRAGGEGARPGQAAARQLLHPVRGAHRGGRPGEGDHRHGPAPALRPDRDGHGAQELAHAAGRELGHQQGARAHVGAGRGDRGRLGVEVGALRHPGGDRGRARAWCWRSRTDARPAPLRERSRGAMRARRHRREYMAAALSPTLRFAGYERMFRTKYLDYAELTAQLAAWAKAHPDLVRVTSIGKTAEGRDIPLVTIGRNPHEARPAVWVDGNMHASELCGSSVALAIAEDVIAIHEGGNEAGGRPPAAHGGGDQGNALLRRAAHLARRRRGGAEDRPVRPLEPRGRRAGTRATRTGKRPTSTATARMGYMRQACPGRGAGRAARRGRQARSIPR